MKKMFIMTVVALAGISSAFATFSERKLESAKKSASQSGKGIAFVFWQEYWDPRCPKCVAQVNANNSALKKAIPRSAVVVVEIDPGEKGLEALPSNVPAPDRKKADEFEAKVKAAVGK